MIRPTTYFVDIDGVIVRHLGQGSGKQWNPERMSVLTGTREWFDEREKEGDKIVLTTARPETTRRELETFLRAQELYWHALVMGITSGDRVLINDAHPTYITLARVIERNAGLRPKEAIQCSADTTG